MGDISHLFEMTEELVCKRPSIWSWDSQEFPESEGQLGRALFHVVQGLRQLSLCQLLLIRCCGSCCQLVRLSQPVLHHAQVGEVGGAVAQQLGKHAPVVALLSLCSLEEELDRQVCWEREKQRG